MELILSLIGTITGVIALIATIVIQFRYERLSVEQERKNERMIAEQERKNEERERKNEERERLLFLSNVIFDTSIPRESRQAFYDEYIAKKGNGPVVRFWLLEGEKEKKALEK